MNDQRHIASPSRAIMIEEIMALIGRASNNPRSYRRTLESFETETLARTLRELTGDLATETVALPGNP